MRQEPESGADSMELLAPAGTLEKAKVAIAYGADAIYLAGKRFGLRARAGNFATEDLSEIVSYAHDRGVRVYVTVNVIPHNHDLEGLPQYLSLLGRLEIDAVIVADPGVLSLAREVIPQVDVHLSTQANAVNWQSVRFWYRQGVRRVILARELSGGEIEEIHRRVPEVELEMFVHGAMCISYSGRCLLSAYLAGRDANLGDCAQPCRWKYRVTAAKHDAGALPVEEAEEGTYIFNSRDLCLIDEIPRIARSGVCSIKIEGRMKSVHYVASVVGAYRAALDRYRSKPDNYAVEPAWREELDKVSHRPYTKGFFCGAPGPEGQDYAGAYTGTSDFVGLVVGREGDGTVVIDVRNRIRRGESLEVLLPGVRRIRYELAAMTRADTGEPVEEAHPNHLIKCSAPFDLPLYSVLRRNK